MTTSLAQLVKNPKVIVGIASVLSFSAGAGSVYFVLSKKLEEKYARISEQEIAEAKRYYSVLNKTGEYADPVKLLEEYVEEDIVENILDEEGYREVADQKLVSVDGDVVTVAEAKRNLFKDAKSANSYFDYDKEIPKRKVDRPYIITHDEFMAGERDFVQATLTYYEGDGVLVDERNEVINETDSTVGNKNLERFGHGSTDHNVVYIRNEVLDLDFEVVRSNGDYATQVLGFIKHAHTSRKTRKFRSDDE